MLQELDFIVEARKTAQTIIVHSPPSGVEQGAVGALFPGNAVPELNADWEQTLRHFPHRIAWSELDDRLAPAIEATYAAPSLHNKSMCQFLLR